MKPIDEIRIGGVYTNPMLRGYGIEWLVIDKSDGLVQVQGLQFETFVSLGSPIWKYPSDRMFSDSWQVQKGWGDD